jgi:hypothetical protein
MKSARNQKLHETSALGIAEPNLKKYRTHNMSEKLKSMPLPAKPSDCPPTAPNLLTAVEAALVLHMDHRTLIRWARAGYVPAHPLGEGRRRLWRFFRDELLVWVQSQSNGREDAFRRAA